MTPRDLNENDVLCGRGTGIDAYQGNVRYREIIKANKKEYFAMSRKGSRKKHFAAHIVKQIRSKNPPGRFLKKDPEAGLNGGILATLRLLEKFAKHLHA
jgi:hypothetical protein